MNKVSPTIFERILACLDEKCFDVDVRGKTIFKVFGLEMYHTKKRKDVEFSQPKHKRFKKDISRAIIYREDFKDKLSRFSKPDKGFQILNLFQQCKDVRQMEILERNVMFLLETENDRPHHLAETFKRNSREIFESDERLWWVRDDHCANYHIAKLFPIFRLIELGPVGLVKFFNSIPQTPSSLKLVKELDRVEFSPIRDDELCFVDLVRLCRSTLSKSFVNRCFVTNNEIFQITLSMLAATKKEDIRNFFEILHRDNIPLIFTEYDVGYNSKMMKILVFNTSDQFIDNNFETILRLVKTHFECDQTETIVHVGQNVSTHNIQRFFETVIRCGFSTREFLDHDDGRRSVIKPILDYHIFRDPQISTLIPFVRFFENLKQSKVFSQLYRECKQLGIFE